MKAKFLNVDSLNASIRHLMQLKSSSLQQKNSRERFLDFDCIDLDRSNSDFWVCKGNTPHIDHMIWSISYAYVNQEI